LNTYSHSLRISRTCKSRFVDIAECSSIKPQIKTTTNVCLELACTFPAATALQRFLQHCIELMEPLKEEEILKSVLKSKTRAYLRKYVVARQQKIFRKEIRARRENKWRPVLETISEDSVESHPWPWQQATRSPPTSRTSVSPKTRPTGATLERLQRVQLPTATAKIEHPTATSRHGAPRNLTDTRRISITALQQATTSARARDPSRTVTLLWRRAAGSAPARNVTPFRHRAIGAAAPRMTFVSLGFGLGFFQQVHVPAPAMGNEPRASSQHAVAHHNLMGFDVESQRNTVPFELQQAARASAQNGSPVLQQATRSARPRRIPSLRHQATSSVPRRNVSPPRDVPAPPRIHSLSPQQVRAGDGNAIRNGRTQQPPRASHGEFCFMDIGYGSAC